jgi:hypothetical protein
MPLPHYKAWNPEKNEPRLFFYHLNLQAIFKIRQRSYAKGKCFRGFRIFRIFNYSQSWYILVLVFFAFFSSLTSFGLFAISGNSGLCTLAEAYIYPGN